MRATLQIPFLDVCLVLFLVVATALTSGIGMTAAEAQQSGRSAERAAKSQIEEMMPPIGPGEITVGLMGPITDLSEARIKKYLDSAGLDHVIQVVTVWEVLPKLADVSIKAGKQIKYLILGGHGSPDPTVPGFGIGKTAFGSLQINFTTLEFDILKDRKGRNEKIKELCTLRQRGDTTERKPGTQAGTLSAEGREHLLMKEIDEIDQRNRERMKRITAIHDAQGIMAEDGVIVLFNCFSGLKEHLNFAMDLGVLLFGGKRGKIYVHEKSMLIGEVPEDDGAWKSIMQLLGYFTEGYLKAGGKAIVWANFEILPVPKLEPRLIPETLPAAVTPSYTSVPEGTAVNLKADVETLNDSVTLEYEWQGCAEKNSTDCLVETAGKKDSQLQGKVLVRDKMNRTGEGRFCVVIEKQKETDPGVIKKPSKKQTIKAAAYRKMTFIRESVGKGATNLKDGAFYDAMWPLSQASVSPVKKLGEPGFAEEWLVKIPVTVEIEGDFKIAEHGAYAVQHDPGVVYTIALDPKYGNSVEKVTLSGFPPRIGPAKAERLSHSAGLGWAWGSALKTVVTFRGAKASDKAVSYNYHVERWTVPKGKKEFVKHSEGEISGYSFSLNIGAYDMTGKKPFEEPRETKVSASSLEFNDAGTARFTAIVTGVKPDEEPVAYQWSGVSTSKGNTAELKVADDGEFSVSCRVVSAGGILIGSDTVKVKSELNAKKAREKVEEAKKLAAEGKLDEAIARADAAAKLDPKNPDAGPLAARLRNEKERVMGHLEKMNGFVQGENFGEAQREFNAANSLHPGYLPVIEAGKLLTSKKGAYDKKVASSAAALEKAKKEAHIGKLDESIASAQGALQINPKNRAASDFIRHVQSEKANVVQGLDSVRKIMAENRYPDAQNALIPIKNKYPYYPPVQQANQELGGRWNKYNSEVRDKVFEVRSANEKKDFGKALEIAAAWRASTKLDPYAERELKQQEDWAKQWKARKDRQIGVLREAGEKVRNYDYAGALKQYDEGFANGQNIYNGTEPEYKEAVELRSQAFTKNKRLNELIPWVRKAAEDKEYMTVDVLQNTLKTADEAIALQPTNGQLKQWRAQIVARAEKTKADNERIAAGRKYFDAAGRAERSFLTNESSIQARQIQWGEKLEEQQQRYLATAIENYRESLKYIPDASVAKKIRELEATLEGRKKYLAGVRQTGQVQAEAAKKATADRLWQEGTALYHQGRPADALAKFKESLGSWSDASRQKYVADMESRRSTAVSLRNEGAALQRQNRIPEAVAKYKGSLGYWSDAALADHIRKLEATASRPVAKTSVPTTRTASKGYWRLVDRKSETKKSSNNCYPAEVKGMEGNLTVRLGSVCGENGSVSVKVRWTMPPETLTPGETIRIETELTPTVSGTQRGIDEQIGVLFDNADILCGSGTAGRIKIIAEYGAGVGNPGGRKVGEVKVPDRGRFAPPDVLKLSVCLRNYHQYYLYHWTQP